MDPARKSAIRALKILRSEIYSHPIKRIEMSKSTFEKIREGTRTNLFDLAEDKSQGDLGSLDGVRIVQNDSVLFSRARVF